MPLLDGLIPIMILVALELLIPASRSNHCLPAFYQRGKPRIIINNGKIDIKALNGMRVDRSGLMESLRSAINI